MKWWAFAFLLLLFIVGRMTFLWANGRRESPLLFLKDHEAMKWAFGVTAVWTVFGAFSISPGIGGLVNFAATALLKFFLIGTISHYLRTRTQ
jgi:hypothetical protein